MRNFSLSQVVDICKDPELEVFFNIQLLCPYHVNVAFVLTVLQAQLSWPSANIVKIKKCQ